ncbi:hypothetical protein MLD38_006592 [Melastoma candidum]|uniref:Uncharacterized protein n=1 Tax=Melastoma candidum TaxID=119954 RepID=A0ACB9RN44_9MYRT|nr:hypothetical protein MLD38_006592 [Melastoma candidum]
MPSSTPKGHVVVIPFPSDSHAPPLFNLVRNLASSAPTIRFSFLSTPESNSSLFYSGSDTLSSLPSILVYDVGAGKSPDQFLKSAKSNYEGAIGHAERESGIKASCLLTDVFMLFACEIAESLSIKWIPFWVGAPCSLSTFLYADVISDFCRDHDNKPGGRIRLSTVPGLSEMYLEDVPKRHVLEQTDSLISAMFNSIRHVLPRASLLVLNSYKEANPRELVEDLKSKFKGLLHVGCQTVSFQPPSPEVEPEDETGCLSWLNIQEPKTVAYICFGSIANISPEEIRAVATALEETRTPFLWSLKEDFRAHFPSGFQDRTEHHGKVVSWAPQSLVLRHTACGVYVTHCGYNSVFESVAGLVPMICRPIWADNMMNGRMVEEVWRIGVKVDRANGVITTEGMAKCLRMVLGGGEEGRMLREMIELFREKLAAAAAEEGSAGMDLRSLVEIITSL